jgi:integrase
MSNKVSVLKSSKKNYPWYVSYPDGGIRKKKYFQKKERAGGADEWARGKRNELKEKGSQHAAITDTEFDAVKKFREAVAELPAKASGTQLDDAVVFYLKHLKVKDKSITCLEVADKLLLNIQREGRGKRHLSDVTSRLKRFTDDYGDWLACDISTDVIDEYLDELEVASQTKLNYRNKVNQLFLYAVKIGACDSNPVEDSIKPKVTGSEIGILSLTQVATLLSCANDTVLAGLAISFFAGVRSSEIERLDWADIDLEEGHIDIKAKNAKSARRRIVNISANLKAWLLPYEQHEGLVMGDIPWQWRSGKEEAIAAAKIKDFPHNAGRHSFASYHVAYHQNAPLTALELGHSNANLLFQRYRAIVTKKIAATYWSITPTEADNIIKMKTA